MIDTLWIKNRVENLTGKIALSIIYTETGESFSVNGDEQIIAASLIKLPVMVEAFRQWEHRQLDWSRYVSVKPDMKMPSCGALSYIHDGAIVTVKDLVTLMIILSDNTAANIMIDILGMSNINACIRSLNLNGTKLNRRLFDSALSAAGIENYTTANDMARLMHMLYRKSILSAKSSEEMLDILKNQRLNGKIPFFLHDKGVKCAHKTGEDSGITHDAGIVYAKKPFIFSFLSQNTNVPETERAIQDIAYHLTNCGE